MKLSQTEHKIKKSLANREIQPSAKLWDNIQSELDKDQKPKSKVLWFRLAGVAAVLCLCFLAYQGFQNTRETLPTLVLKQKGTIAQPLKFNTQNIDYLVLPKPNEIANNFTTTQVEQEPKTEVKETLIETSVANQSSSTIEDEVESLLQNANQKLAKVEQEKLLIAEVDNLLNEAIENTQDTEQQTILKSMQARLLLAEVESEIELTKPPNLKDKIWEAIVSNYNDLKSSVALN
jgi:ribosomal protein S3AE